MPKSVSHCAVVGGCDILPAARTCPLANGTTGPAAAAAGTAAGAAAPPAPNAAMAAMAAPRIRANTREPFTYVLHFAVSCRPARLSRSQVRITGVADLA